MQHEKGDELLLSRADRVEEGTAVSQNAEPTEELDAKGNSTGHPPILWLSRRRHESRGRR
jgi:hypothetical protein